MSENKNYVSNIEVQKALAGESKVKYLKEKLIAILVVLILFFIGIYYFISDKNTVKETKHIEKEIDNKKKLNTNFITENEEIDYKQELKKETNDQEIKTLDTISTTKQKSETKNIIKDTEINIDFQMTEQNKFTWNPEISSSGLITTIVIETGSGHVYQKDVTGSSSFKFKSGDTRFDGVKSVVKLIIQNKEGFKIKGSKELIVKTTC